MKDMHNNIDIISTITPAPMIASAVTGTVVDRQGYDSVEFAINYGAVTATAAVFTPVVLEGDVTGTMTSVADADLQGTEVLASLAAAVRTDGTTEKVTKRIGYVGSKRYVSLNIGSTTTAVAAVSADVILGNPARAPVAT